MFPSENCRVKKTSKASIQHPIQVTALTGLFLGCLLVASCGAGSFSNPVSQPAAKSIAVTPTNVDFGDVEVSASSVLPTVVTNTGNASVTVSSVEVSGEGFRISGPSVPFTLAPGQTASLNTTFSPSTDGTADGTISLLSNASNHPTVVKLHGKGSPKKKHLVGLQWDPPVPESGVTVEGYNIYRGIASPSSGCTGISFLQDGSTSGESSTSFTDNAVQGGQTYCYRVTAITNSDETSPSNIAQAVIPSP